MTDHTLPPAADQSADDHLLEELASLTGLFNPEQIWHTEEKLDDLDDQEAAAHTAATPPTADPIPTAS